MPKRYTAALNSPTCAAVFSPDNETFCELDDTYREPEKRRSPEALLNAAHFIADVLNLGAHMIATGARA